MADDAPRFLTTRELAELLRVKERKIYDLAAAGAVPHRRVTGKLLFPRAEIEAWIADGAPEAAPPPNPANAAPLIVAGSHDPLLEWALRESGSGLPAFFDGSLDGLARLGRDEAAAAGIHVYEPESDGWNVETARAQLSAGGVVLIEWARRQRGLIVAPDGGGIARLADLKGRRVAARQKTAGARILFDALLAQAGLGPGDLIQPESPARTETEAAEAVAAGAADAAPGLECVARAFRLGFLPLREERFDLVIMRRAYFEPPFQALFAFARSPVFAAHARALGGYDVASLGRVHWNP